MPTLEENPSEVSPVTLPLSLPEEAEPPSLQAAVTGESAPRQEASGVAAEPGERGSRVSWGSVHELLAQVERESAEMLPSPYDYTSPPRSPHTPLSPEHPVS